MKRRVFLFFAALLVSCLFIGEIGGIWWKTPSRGARGKTPTAGVGRNSGSGTAGSSASVIPYFEDGESVGNIPNAWTEISGIQRGMKSANESYLWAIGDDKISPPQLLAIGISTAGTFGEWSLTAGSASDMEGIAGVAVGTQTWIYLVDSGDNSSVRTSFNIFRTREPTITGGNGSLAAGTDYETIVATYPAANLPSNKDVECAFIDPNDYKLYLITKRITPILIYSLPWADSYAGTQQLTYGGTTYAFSFSTQASGSNNGYITGCDISPNGLEVVVKNYATGWTFTRTSTNTTIPEMFRNNPPVVFAGYVGWNRPASHPNNEPQGEAIAYSPANDKLWSASEIVTAFGSSASASPLYKYDRLSSTYTEVSFQDGLGVSTSNVDTYLYSAVASSVAFRGGETTFVSDWNATSPTDERQSLVKFNITGIASTNTIVGVDLFLTITTEGSSFEAYVMYDSWAETDTYATRGSFPARNGVGASATAFARHSGYATLTGQIQVNVPNSVVQDWVSGVRSNQGFLIYSDDIPGGNGFQFGSRENATLASRPKLVIRYI